MWIVIAVLLAFILLVVVPMAATVYTQYLWFASIGQTSVFATTISSQAALFALGAGVFLALAMLNLMIARAVVRRTRDLPTAREGVLTYIARIQARSTDRYVTYGALLVALLVSVVMGITVSSRWLLVLRYLHLVPFAASDPLFGLDASFYVFQLPIYRFLQGW
ncbi:MAG TPA: UPF0182 family protein, partial [Chloroflexota bacterium]|nr:UPF0182 family protein [Chloroflexota bacterium]